MRFGWIMTAAVAVVGGVVSQASASFVVKPVATTADSAWGPGTKAEFAGSGAGLSDPSIVETNDPIPADWPTHVTTNTNVNWMSASSTGDALRWIEFDLGQPFMLSGIHVWNYNVANDSDKGMKIVDILVSSDGTSYMTVADDITFARAPESSSYAGESYAFQSLVNGRYVRLECYKRNNWGDSSFVGLSEARLIGEIPEPAGCCTLMVGLGLLAGRRRQAA